MSVGARESTRESPWIEQASESPVRILPNMTSLYKNRSKLEGEVYST